MAVPAEVPAASVQLAEVGLKVPVLFVVKLTLPPGVVGVAEVSVTVAVHEEAVPVLTEAGTHVMLVVVACKATGVDARRNVPWLGEWAESPVYEPVIW